MKTLKRFVGWVGGVWPCIRFLIRTRKLDPDCDFRILFGTVEGVAAVCINSNSYYLKTLKFAHELHRKLKRGIPFPYRITSEPTISILGGPRVSGMMNLEFNIAFGLSKDEVLKICEKSGLWWHRRE